MKDEGNHLLENKQEMGQSRVRLEDAGKQHGEAMHEREPKRSRKGRTDGC